MTTRNELPEEATQIPTIHSPDEDAERATRRQEQSERMYTAKEALHMADPHNPLRMPGEMSSRPDEEG
jgi:hypothetical protein